MQALKSQLLGGRCEKSVSWFLRLRGQIQALKKTVNRGEPEKGDAAYSAQKTSCGHKTSRLVNVNPNVSFTPLLIGWCIGIPL